MPRDKEYVPIQEDMVKTFDDIPEDQIVDIDTISLEDIVGREMVIFSFTTKPSEFGKGIFYILEVEFEGEKVEVNTGAGAVCRQVEAYQPFFPLRVLVCQSGRKYYLDKA